MHGLRIGPLCVLPPERSWAHSQISTKGASANYAAMRNCIAAMRNQRWNDGYDRLGSHQSISSGSTSSQRLTDTVDLHLLPIVDHLYDARRTSSRGGRCASGPDVRAKFAVCGRFATAETGASPLLWLPVRNKTNAHPCRPRSVSAHNISGRGRGRCAPPSGRCCP